MPNFDGNPQQEVTLLAAIAQRLGADPRYIMGQEEVALLRLILAGIGNLVENGSFPNQAGQNGKFLATDGTNPFWAALTGGGDMTSAVYDPAGVGAQLAGASGQAIDAAAFLTALGATTVGKNLFTLGDPGAITYIRINADNSISVLSASDFRSAIGAGTSSFSGAYADLSGKPTLGTAAAENVEAFATAAQGTKADSALQPNAAASVTTLSASGIFTSAAAKVTPASAMAALAIDVTKISNSKTISADQTFTFSGTPGASNQWFGVDITNSDGSAHTLTIPSSFSVARQGSITSVEIPANGFLSLLWKYDGSVYKLYGDPPATSGTGAFALVTGSAINLGSATNLPASAIAAGVLAANVTLGEAAGQIVLDPTLSADERWSGIMQAGTAGATLAFGDLVYFAAADSRWELADAAAEATAGPVKLGMCVLAAAADGDPTNILLFGKIRADAAFPTLTIGAPAYVGTTAGDIQVAQPSGTDDVIRIVGHADTADVLLFNPDGFYITHT